MVDWKLQGSKVVFDRFMQIEERTYLMPDGTVKQFYIKITKPAVCVLALTDDQQILLVEQFRPGPTKRLCELPGGYMEEGETPAQAAARELLEETGYAGELAFVTDCFDDAYTTMKRSCFVVTNCRPTKSQHLDDGEFINLKKVSLIEFLKIVRAGQMTDVEVALLGLDYLGLLQKATP